MSEFDQSVEGLKLDPEDRDLLAVKWHLNNGYLRGRIDGKRVYLHQVIARRMGIVGTPDHRNRIRTDNRRGNLRPATGNQNNANQAGHSDRVHSNYKGVTRGRRSGWVAQIRFNGTTKGLGTYGTDEDAAKAYDKAARFIFGEFAVCNFEGSEAAHPDEILKAARESRSRFGVLGVTFNKREGKYRAYKIGGGRKYVGLGTFATLEEAIAAARAQQS